MKRIKRLVSYYHESTSLTYRKSHTDEPYSRLLNRPVLLWLRPPGESQTETRAEERGHTSTCLLPRRPSATSPPCRSRCSQSKIKSPMQQQRIIGSASGGVGFVVRPFVWVASSHLVLVP